MSNIQDYCYKIFLIDDEIYTLQSYEIALRSGGIDNILVCQDSRNVESILEKEKIGIVLLDLTMPFLTGKDLLHIFHEKYPDILVIVTTAVNEIETAVECMRSGAFDYLVKPIDKNELNSIVKRAIGMLELQNENYLLRQHMLSGKLEYPEVFENIITNNKTMLSIFQYVESIAFTSQPLLITGETGVGKELIAKIVHNISKRKGEFLAVNAGGLDDNVFADTLFGHIKGSFTGANEKRKGLIETASGGTLFLDEIGELSQTSQVKLLRLLQENEYFPIGSDLPKKSKARIIVATNKTFTLLQDSNSFRKDLYYRLRSHHIYIPPLRERKDDIELLLDYFLSKASSKLGKKKPTAPNELLFLLKTYNFPGNIRELEAMVFDAVSNHKSKKLSMDIFKNWIFKDKSDNQGTNDLQVDNNNIDEIQGETLISFSSKLPTLKQAVQLTINEAMERSNGNQNIAASQLGITRQALNKRLQAIKTSRGV